MVATYDMDSSTTFDKKHAYFSKRMNRTKSNLIGMNLGWHGADL